MILAVRLSFRNSLSLRRRGALALPAGLSSAVTDLVSGTSAAHSLSYLTRLESDPLGYDLKILNVLIQNGKHLAFLLDPALDTWLEGPVQ